MRKLIRGCVVEVVELFEGNREVGVLIRKESAKVGEFWVVRREKREIVRLIVERVKALGGECHAH